MSGTERPSSTRVSRLSAGVVVAGLLALVIGRVLLEAGEQAWLLGTTRAPAYFGPASLLRTDASGRGALVVGAVVSLAGLAVLLVGVYRLASEVDMSAKPVPPAARTSFPSAALFTAGLLAAMIGSALYRAGELAAVVTRLDSPIGSVAGLLGRHHTGQALGASVAVVGFVALLLGLHRLLTNVQLNARTLARSR